MHLVLLMPSVENYLFYIVCFSTLVENQLTLNAQVYLWVFNSVSLGYLPVFKPVPYFFDYGSFII